MEVLFREALKTDAAALLKHIRAVGAETDNLSFSGDTFNISEEREAKFIDRFSRSRDDIMLVALDGDKIVGNAIVERNRVERYHHRAEISITVLKEYWGKGIGSRLMEMMIDFARNAGIKILYLEVRADNKRAIELYKKYGFCEIGVYEDFFKIDEKYYDARLMTLKL